MYIHIIQSYHRLCCTVEYCQKCQLTYVSLSLRSSTLYNFSLSPFDLSDALAFVNAYTIEKLWYAGSLSVSAF